MTRKPVVPDEDAEEAQPASYGAVMAPYGVMSVVPRPRHVGRPAPEPEERWTLGPGRPKPKPEAPETADQPPARSK